MTKVFKFGGASLKDSLGIKNVADILEKYKGEPVLIVVSAMGKTTDALVEVTRSFFRKDGQAAALLAKIKRDHCAAMTELLEPGDDAFAGVSDLFVEAEWAIEGTPQDEFDYLFDQIVGVGELVCSKIVAAYLNRRGLKTHWLDAREVVATDETWRESVVQWDETLSKIQKQVKPFFESGGFVLTQGFIGSSKDNATTTLGREGSDYSAAIFSHCLDAEAMYIWKDVPGVLNGDPRIFHNTVQLYELSYDEAVEMTYYGATVVHPRTIQPLQSKNIPLHVRSFKDHEARGTVISGSGPDAAYPPILMTERNQVFLKLRNKDRTFLVEPHIRDLFALFARFGIFVNLLQNSGSYFYVSITEAPEQMEALMRELKVLFETEATGGVDLITVRHPTPEKLAELKQGKTVLFDKMIPDTYQMVVSY